VTLVRTSTGHIFGGFTAVSWRRGDLVTKPPRWVPSCVADPEAFVFRLYAPSNWTGVSYDEAFSVNHTAEMAEPYFTFLREQEAKARRLHAAAVSAETRARGILLVSGAGQRDTNLASPWASSLKQAVETPLNLCR